MQPPKDLIFRISYPTMTNFESLQLQKGKEKALQRRHPWIFSGAFKELPAHLPDGELVEVKDAQQNFKALGFFHQGKIAVRVLSFEPVENVSSLIGKKISQALGLRQKLGLIGHKNTNCCRLVFAEGDGLPGLIIDRYADTAVVQVHLTGWLPYLDTIADALLEHNFLQHVYSKPADKLGAGEHHGWLRGGTDENTVLENGHRFLIDWEEGQKTGFFIDQRENRRRLGELAHGKKVLNTFSYTGGFSIYALANGATKAVSVDISQAAVDLADENARLNGFADRHESFAGDVFEYLQAEGDGFDVIVLDPPAFSKSRRTTHKAVQAYKRLNALAMKKIKPGGIIFTFSCSQHVDPKLFEDTLRAAAITTGKNIRILERLVQPADHPVSIYHPEGEYLKGMVLEVS